MSAGKILKKTVPRAEKYRSIRGNDMFMEK